MQKLDKLEKRRKKDIKMAKKKESKNEPGLEGRVEAIFEILAQHKVDIEYLSSKIDELSTGVDKVKGRMGI